MARKCLERLGHSSSMGRGGVFSGDFLRSSISVAVRFCRLLVFVVDPVMSSAFFGFAFAPDVGTLAGLVC